MKKTIYTIGHSTHSLDVFIDLLQQYNINCIVDVRSTPFSKFNEQYNKPTLMKYLKTKDIVYLHMGKEFGARRDEEFLYNDDGQVNFLKVFKTQNFLKGVERIKNGLKKEYNIAFMCSEKNPIECHRSIMIGRYFVLNHFEVLNILADKTILNQLSIEEQLLKKYENEIRNEYTLFSSNILSEKEQLSKAYECQERKIAYKKGDESID